MLEQLRLRPKLPVRIIHGPRTNHQIPFLGFVRFHDVQVRPTISTEGTLQGCPAVCVGVCVGFYRGCAGGDFVLLRRVSGGRAQNGLGGLRGKKGGRRSDVK